MHDELGVIADQFYAERLYTRESIGKLLEKTGFRNVRHHGNAEALSDRDQDLGMMARRLLLSADGPQLPAAQATGKVAAARRDRAAGRPAASRYRQARRHVQPRGPWRPSAASRMRSRELPDYKFRYLDNHATLERDLSELSAPSSSSTCATRDSTTIPSRSCTSRPCWRRWASPTRAPGRPRLRACYDKGLVRAVAMTLDVPVPLETYVRPGDQGATLPSVFPALLKPNYGDSSQGITKDAVVTNAEGAARLLSTGCGRQFPRRPVLVQEFLTGGRVSASV